MEIHVHRARGGNLGLFFSRTGGQFRMEACTAAIDGGALFALAPVRFALVLPVSGGECEVRESRATMTGNVAASRGGAIATWAPIFVEFGYRLVCAYGHNIRDVGACYHGHNILDVGACCQYTATLAYRFVTVRGQFYIAQKTDNLLFACHR